MKRKILATAALLLILIFAFCACGQKEKVPSAISVVEGSIALEYTVGDTPDLSTLKAVITYDNGEAETVGSDKLTVTGLDTSTAGTKTVTIKWGDLSTTVSVTVKDKAAPVTLSSIKILSNSISTSIALGDTLNLSGIQVEATYSDGTTKPIAYADLQISGVNTAVAGKQTLTVTYGGKSANIEINVIGVTSIQVSGDTLKNEIMVGSALDTSALKALVTYSDGKTEIVGVSQLTVGLVDTTTPGEKYLSIEYKGFTLSYKVTVIGVSSIKINPGSVATSVRIGTALDTSSVSALLTYTNGNEKALSASELVVSPVDTSSAGDKTLTVSYGSVSDSVTVKVVGVDKIIPTGALKYSVMVGETYSLEGVKFTVVYTDPTIIGNEFLEYTAFDVEGIDTATAGKKTLKVTYLDKTAEFEIWVNQVESLVITEGSVATSVKVNGTLDVSEISATATYTDGSTKVLSADDLTVLPFDSTAAGEKALTVTCGSAEATLTVTVIGVSSITVLTGTVPTEVLVGEAFVTDNARASVQFSDGETVNVTAADLTFGTLDTASAGTKQLKITYLDKTVDYEVKVCGIESIRVDGVPMTVTSSSDKSVDLSLMKVYAVYSDSAKTAKLISEGYTTNNGQLDLTGEGDTLVVTYQSFTAQVVISTSAPDLSSVTIDVYKPTVAVAQAYDLTAVKGTALFGNGARLALNYGDAGVTVTIGSTDAAGNITLKLSYTYAEKSQTKETEVTVKVLGITSVFASGLPSLVNIGSDLDTSALKLTVTYGEGSEAIVGEITEGITVSGYDKTKSGDQTVTVSYLGSSTTHKLHVKAVSSIELLGAPETVRYGATVNTSGISIKITYTDGSTVTKTAEALGAAIAFNVGDTLTDADSVSLGATYTENGVAKTASANVSVLKITDISVSGVDKVVNLGDTLNTDNLTLTVTYSNGTVTESDTVTKADGVTVDAFSTASSGDKKLVVRYLGKSAEYDVHVRAVSSIAILSGTIDSVARYKYVNTSGIQLQITYSNGDVEIKAISALGNAVKVSTTYGYKSIKTISQQYVDKAVSAAVKVDYTTASGTVSTTANLKIYDVDTVSALNGSVPASINKGGSLYTASMKLTVYYFDYSLYLNDYTYYPGETFVYIIDANDPLLSIDVSKVDLTVAGEYAIIFTFNGGDSTHSASTVTNLVVREVENMVLVPGSIETTVNVGKDIDTKDISFKVELSDNTYSYVGIDDGLVIGSIDTSAAGVQKLKVSYLGFEIEVAISVIDASAGSDGFIYGASRPDDLVARDAYKKNFKDQTAAYVVGDDNPYYFYLNLLMLDENDEIINVDGKNFRSIIKVYLVDGNNETELTGDTLASYVAVDRDKNSYDFTEAAIGKVFRLEIRPDSELVADVSAVTMSHTVTVVDAYNIYEAWELNVLSNRDRDIDGSTGTYLSQRAAVEKFLIGKGIADPAKILDTLSGVVLHGNISIGVDDLPEEYYFTYEKNGITQFTFYDEADLFNHGATSSRPTFDFHGNYYSIYSYELPCVVETGYHPTNSDSFSNSELLYFGIRDELMATSFNHKNYSVNMNNVAFRDNDPNSNDQSASERHMRGIACLKTSHLVSNITNVNIDAYYISMVPEGDNQTVNLEKVKFYNAWQGHIFIWNNNYMTSHFWGEDSDQLIPNHQNVIVNISNSLLAKCGGPVILSQNDNKDKKMSAKTGADVNVTNSTLYSYVTGQEAWFVAVGQTAMAGQILAMSNLVSAGAAQAGTQATYLSDKKITGVSTMNLIMVNMGSGFGFEDYGYEGSYTEDGVTGLYMKNTDEALPNYFLLNTKEAVKEYGAPIFQTSEFMKYYQDGKTHGTCFTDNQSGVYTDLGVPATSAEGCFSGKFITLYTMGMGVMLEYYNETNPDTGKPVID